MRSKTDIAIVFVTLIPPTISARIETIQPVEISRRLAVSTFTACPGSVIAVSPGKARSSRAATADAVCPGSTVTPIEVTSPGRPESRSTVCSGSTMPRSSKRLPEW